ERRLQQPAGLVRLPVRDAWHLGRVVLLQPGARQPGRDRGRSAGGTGTELLPGGRPRPDQRRGVRGARLRSPAVPGEAVCEGGRRLSAVRLLLDLGEDRPALAPSDVLREVAGRQVVADLFLERRLGLGTRRGHAGYRAARVEAAPRRRMDRRRYFPRQLDEPPAALNLRIRNRYRGQQRFRVRMLGVAVGTDTVGDLHDLAQV